MKTIRLASLLLCLVGLIQLGCKRNSTSSNSKTSTEISQSVLDAIAKQGFSPYNVKTVEGGYLVEGDIFLSSASLSSSPTLNSVTIASTEQYSTQYTVSGLPRTITVRLNFTGFPIFTTALDDAIGRYNALNLRLKFQRVSSGGQIIMDNKNLNQPQQSILGQSSDFPLPGGVLGPGHIILDVNEIVNYFNLPEKLIASIIAHEIGHKIGFRHTDWKNRNFSCGGGSQPEPKNTPIPPYGTATFIPGTPSGADAGSWMLACIGNSDRPFNANDKIALNYLFQ